MRKLITAVLFMLGFAAFASAQQLSPPGTLPIGVQATHNDGYLFYSLAYQTWQAKVLVGNSATGSGATITVTSPSALIDNYVPPAAAIYGANTGMTFPKLYISDAVAETITPTAVSIGACPVGTPGPIGSLCATITATINNTHGPGAFVLSGDQGIAEAMNDAFLSGGGLVYWVADTGNVTLNTGGLTTTTTTFVPTNFLSEGAAARVTTTITVTASWAVGISGSTSAFCTANSTLTAGTTCVANMNSPATVGTSQGLTAVLITGATSNPGAGAVHVRVWGFSAVQPSF
jgi:hypothetical protein